MSGLLDRIGEMLGMKKKPGTNADPVAAPSRTRVADKNPDAPPTDPENIEPNDPRNDTPTE
jgi:hypothetical protein